MAVSSFVEVIGRAITHRFGESPTAERKFAVTLTDPDTPHQEIFDAIGIYHGSPHPEYGYIFCIEGTISEGNPTPFHAEATFRYEVPRGPAGSSPEAFEPNPLYRPDSWSFSTGGVAIPALRYYHGTGNATVRSLTNSAGDFFEGAMGEEAELRATISGNRTDFPLAFSVAVTNAVNASTYLGAPAHFWKCQGVSAQPVTEIVNGRRFAYWSVSVELVYRQSGWNLLLPNVGWNYVQNGQKRRVYVFDENGEQIPAANPQPLDANGALRNDNPGEANPPLIITRRIYPAIDFATYFGNPPS